MLQELFISLFFLGQGITKIYPGLEYDFKIGIATLGSGAAQALLLVKIKYILG